MSTAAGPPADGSAGSGQDRCTAPRFSVTELAVTRELDLSRIFAHLLNPAASHEQGATFLCCLLKELRASCPKKLAAFPSDPGVESCVRAEYPIGTDGSISGRIDILVDLKDGRRIAIENKPWAWEQPGQIKRYLCYLDSENSPREKVVLLYWIGWSGEGSVPGLSGLKKGLEDRYVRMPYGKTEGQPSVEGWLDSCVEACKAQLVTSFLEDLSRYVRRFPDVASLLYDELKALGAKSDKTVMSRRRGWVFQQRDWSSDDVWAGVWIERKDSLRFDVGASGWLEDTLKTRLLKAGKTQVDNSPSGPDAWIPHGHNEKQEKHVKHVSWTFQGERVFRTDDRKDRERGVKEIMDLVEALMKAADPRCLSTPPLADPDS